MNSETDETWPPAPSKPVVDEKYFRAPGIELSISDDVLVFKMLFIRGFIVRFGLFIAAMIPLLLLIPFVDTVRAGGIAVLARLGPALWQRFLQMVPFIGIVAACNAFLRIIYETMLLRGAFRFDRARGLFWAGAWPHSTRGMRYVAVRRQVSKTRTWTRWCFYVGFDHDAGVRFDRFNFLHRLAAIYGEAARTEYYLGYITGRESAERVAQAIANFMGVEFRAEDG